MKSTLVFVYNADSGIFNAFSDLAHKLLSPETYPCSLCAITYSSFGMRKEWRLFLKRLDVEKEFLHADELKDRYGIEGVTLPAIFRKEAGLSLWIDADAINGCSNLGELKELIRNKLQDQGSGVGSQGSGTD